MAKNLLIYIAGYGRSGSTILDLALSAVCREAVSCGEVGMLPKVVSRPRLGCSCGHHYDSCKVWANVLKNTFPDQTPPALTDIYKEDGFAGWLFRPSEKYLRFWGALFERRHNIGLGNKNPSWVIIDSSKTVFRNSSRPLNLARLNNTDVVLIHLKRPLSGVLSSRRRGRNIALAGLETRKNVGRWVLDSFWRLIVPVNWWLSNFFASVAKRSSNIFLVADVSFDDVKKNPERVAIQLWKAIESASSVQLDIQVAENGIVVPDHIVEGNRLAQSKCGVSIRGM